MEEYLIGRFEAKSFSWMIVKFFHGVD